MLRFHNLGRELKIKTPAGIEGEVIEYIEGVGYIALDDGVEAEKRKG